MSISKLAVGSLLLAALALAPVAPAQTPPVAATPAVSITPHRKGRPHVPRTGACANPGPTPVRRNSSPITPDVPSAPRPKH